jgi:hypothetical protein
MGEDNRFRMVTHMPFLNAPAMDTPGIVVNHIGVLISLRAPQNEIEFGGMISLGQLPLGTPLFVSIHADDNNEFSRDFTDVLITNVSTGESIRPLLYETARNSEIYVQWWQLVGDRNDLLAENQLFANGGDIIVIQSLISPTVRRSAVVAREGGISVFPDVANFCFGPWEWNHQVTGMPDIQGLDRVFTFTNTSGTDDVRLLRVELDGGDAGDNFWIVNADRFTLAASDTGGIVDTGEDDYQIIPPGGSFQVVVRFEPDDTTPGPDLRTLHETTLYLSFQPPTGSPVDRNIALSGHTIDNWNMLLSGDPNQAQIFAIDPFGNYRRLLRQMSVTALVTIDNLPAPIGTIVAAYVSRSDIEELRGKAVVVGPNGLVTQSW